MSAVPIALVVLWLLRPVTAKSGQARLLWLAALGLVPGVSLLLLSQRIVTGSWLMSTQKLYYATSDGPPGCFRIGFGKGIGCLQEHGDFVAARLRDGYGVVAAAGTTLRRLHKHLLDVANLEPLALVVLLPAFLRSRTRGSAVRPATALVVLQVLAYVPFYFDGDYPGGGARFFADVLPVEHALVMIGVALLVSRSSHAEDATISEGRFARCALAVLALSAIGFAVHASHDHVALRDRDGGRPMFEPDVLANASLKTGLVFVETDHGFNLGYDPSARTTDGIVVARLRGDDRDRMVYEALGRPPTYQYKFDLAETAKEPTVTPWTPPESSGSRRLEAEAEWPALTQAGGFAAPGWSDKCASGKRALVITPEPGKRAHVTLELPIPSKGRYTVELRTADGVRIPHTGPYPAVGAEGTLSIGDARWNWLGRDACTMLPAKELDLTPPHAVVTVEAANGPVGLDYFTLRKPR
jgi:hypothetical protein